MEGEFVYCIVYTGRNTRRIIEASEPEWPNPQILNLASPN